MSDYSDGELKRLLDHLIGELRYLQRGELPPDVDLEAAPLLHYWAYSFEPPHRLIGVVIGHPRLREGWIAPSRLVWIDELRGIARTISRYYRLGRKLGDKSSH